MTRSVIDPITRIEGHLRVEMEVENGVVADAWVSGGCFRGMELVVQNRTPEDAAQIVERICGVCPVSHAHASSIAGDKAYGITISNNARIVRNLLEGAQFLHSHILWLYNLAALDYVNPLNALQANVDDAYAVALENGLALHSDLNQLYEKLAAFADNGQLSIFSGNWFDAEDGTGYKLPDEVENEIEAYIDNQCAGLKLATGDDVGRVTYRTDGIKDYTDYLYESINGDLSGLNVCIDCANGASAAVARQLFPRLGAKCTFIGVEPDGKNINAGVGSTHLDNLEKAVVEGGFDCGIAFDGDADRCLACDEKGQEIDGDKVIALLAKNMKEKGCLDGNTAVVTVMSNLGFIKFMESQGIHTEKTAVGDRYVLENMRENGYAIGGEQSGHVILLHHATTGDGELTAGKLLKLLAESGKKMSELNGIYAQYPQVLVNVTANAAQKKAYKEDEVLAGFIENEQQKLMGMGRVLVRVSGTEPKIRVMVEGQDLDAIHRCADRIVDKINKRILGQ